MFAGSGTRSGPTSSGSLIEYLPGFTRTMTKAVEAELEDLASWLGLDAVESA